MEIRVLRYFLTVVREEGINRAAEVLHITQPTLSRQLAQLEDEVGVKLFHRGAKKITLTNEGILLRRRAEEILSLVDRTQRELTCQEELVEGRIVIGGGELAAMQVLSEIIEGFHEKYPLVTFDIFTGNADLVKEQMEKGLVDIGALLEPVDIEKFEFIRLREKERWVVLMRPDDKLAEKETVNIKDLEHMPLILPRRTNVQNEVSNWFGDAFQEQQVLFTSNLTTNSALMVQRGLAYSIVIEGSIPFWDKEKIAYRPLSPELTANSVLAWKKQQPFSLAATKFIEYIKCFPGITKV
ncbi:transcriptional regulator, LysR family [Marvinbryantia formatexigens DSM 14469]|uniref:Transcriptional regulator, LysR family n=1 Tax=Marvinbryantia formatexigens DSM 14469 TaxID=478749 RepID=C6LK40_9FIRM|nr:LysR family transcriptional regulator [Marvinbryantia formatexigens]EET58921.1 transcriptional regulator, LysR family [Marvinbryantia formatexigens DSM 14469]UWO23464.1 LysR family transcriptional regulator [Marvinbryantia formatexigens DSM 14469]SDH19908.1 DNA-binding transcriptional regulator, LysR family [Marvinbryantia formatexigens]